MRIEHVAYWVKDLEKMKNFYQDYFGGKSGLIYRNRKTNFTSYFISFNSGARIELMQNSSNKYQHPATTNEQIGITHLAFSVGSKQKVDIITERLRNDGYEVIGEPRTTGDGYYESVILDPDLNRVEISI